MTAWSVSHRLEQPQALLRDQKEKSLQEAERAYEQHQVQACVRNYKNPLLQGGQAFIHTCMYTVKLNGLLIH